MAAGKRKRSSELTFSAGACQLFARLALGWTDPACALHSLRGLRALLPDYAGLCTNLLVNPSCLDRSVIREAQTWALGAARALPPRARTLARKANAPPARRSLDLAHALPAHGDDANVGPLRDSFLFSGSHGQRSPDRGLIPRQRTGLPPPRGLSRWFVSGTCSDALGRDGRQRPRWQCYGAAW